MDTTPLTMSSLNLSVSAAQGNGMLWTAFLVVMGLAAIAAAILTYHWIAYDNQRIRHIPMQIVYYAGSAGLLAVLVGLVATF